MRASKLESNYQIRSSSVIFFFELYSIFAASICLYSHYTRRNQHDESPIDIQVHAFYTYFGAILAAFFFEAFPRGRSHIQLLSTANQHDKANLFSRWTFHYLQTIISLGYIKTLTIADIEDIMPGKAQTTHAYQWLVLNWERNARPPNLIWVITKTFFWRFLTATAIHLIASSLQFLLPVIIQQILIYIESENTDVPRARGIILALEMFFVSVAVSLLMGQYRKVTSELGLEIRNGLVGMIYRKALVLSPDSRAKASTGSITNHMSTDAEKWTKDLIWVPYWFTVPFEIVVATAMLYNILGWSVFCGLSMIVIVTPIQGYAGQFFDRARDEKYEAMDSRVRLMGELLSNIKNIKLYGYEPAYKEKVNSYRAKEIQLLRKSRLVESFLSIIFTCLPLMMAFVSFAVFAAFGGPGFTPGKINAQVVFVSLSLFALLSRPVGAMSLVTEYSVSLRVASRRIQKFLLKEEIDASAVARDAALPKDPNVAVELDETTALLSSDATRNNQPALIDINLSFARGSLNAIVGRVGRGKSSLLSAIIGEMYKREGVVKVYGSVAYVPQQAWIINATVRDNIVFGKAFDQEKYDRVLFASGLLPDLEILAAGDQTEIGERGINLSGGQKQRVSLARAAYQDADVYLLDDPLSAVDAHVDQHLWENLIGPDGLLKDKTRVLVTHGIHHLEHADHIVVLKDRRIEEAGHYADLMATQNTFYRLIKEFSVNNGSKKKRQHTQRVSDAAAEDEASSITPTSEESLVDQEKANGELVEEEGAQTGVVKWDTFRVYCKAMSYYYVAMTVIFFIVWEAFQLSTPIWLEHWTRVADTTTHSLYYFLIIYGVLVLGYMTVDVYTTYVCFVRACVTASEVLHENLLAHILRLPMSFFDVTPQGRVLNRFSSDIAAIDEAVAGNYIGLFTCVSNLVGALLILVVATPVFVLALPVIGVIYVLIQRRYVRISSMLKRLESVSKSPLYQHFDETLNGVSSIRAMALADRFVEENAVRSDCSANAHYASAMTNYWLNIRLEGLTSITIFIVTLLAVLNKDSLSPSMAGLLLSNTVTLAGHVTWTLRCYCDLAGELVSVERVHEYSNKPTEAPEITGVRLPESWPQHGRIVFKNYSARYRQGLDLVIKRASFDIQAAEKVGVVGRTGAGKSSLMLALFRIIEAADSYWARASEQDQAAVVKEVGEDATLTGSPMDGGSIEIDGVDISTLGLRDLRQHLSIIPQDPTLFAGSVRENLDPFNQATDPELWEALERAHLKGHISSLAGGLSFEVAQNGDNFSVGQRSLICLARALLRKTKILVLDEATAAVDVETDELIQKTIRKEFKDRTIITIAHRIKTIMDSDKILVLERGRVEEFDAPATLMQKQGLFYSLAKQAGEVADAHEQ
ncbi:P-loop containing nucleoside triphosphate hydrolase protein [Gamsiella multidivaricata]|uniref:P-loop containing nucleoside triphosphate hydrolase protein n=1 Tax=Gamsiella multidivaricata TaxID=101098 RepID=UPI0022210D90|nr:P-loop containing nucleoside triphosphate hydrolase protein [Gamsiella multidivaricata]KAI7820518.1 P-loop containing nucleoside triphosphate hydrolase protein [Gamsiella multidivaricata]